MPSCSVTICANRSNVTNFKTCGVTYHRFPKDPKTKEKWIDATGRENNWFPTHHSVICSSHFEEESFLPTAKSRRLLPTAVPTLKLRMVFDTSSTNSREKITAKKTIIKRTVRESILQQYKVKLQRYKNQVNAQQLQIRRLQTMTRRYRKKVDIMKKILDALKNENLIGEDHLWLLESDAIKK